MSNARSQEGESCRGTALVRDHLAAVRKLLPERIELVHRLPKETFSVSLSSARLEQVLLNLARNASDAIKTGGRVVITLDRGDDPAFVELRFADNGECIPSELHERVFEPVFTTKGNSSTGLGLSFTRQIVEGAGGSISMNSVPGTGTEFILRLPRAQEGPRGKDNDSESLPAVRLLLAEDDPQLRSAISRAVRAYGWDVLEVSDGGQAIDALRESRFDVVLVDNNMPTMRGAQVLSEFAASSQGRSNLAILALMSGADISDDLPDGTMKLQKPFGLRDWINQVDKKLGR